MVQWYNAYSPFIEVFVIDQLYIIWEVKLAPCIESVLLYDYINHFCADVQFYARVKGSSF